MAEPQHEPKSIGTPVATAAVVQPRGVSADWCVSGIEQSRNSLLGRPCLPTARHDLRTITLVQMSEPTFNARRATAGGPTPPPSEGASPATATPPAHREPNALGEANGARLPRHPSARASPGGRRRPPRERQSAARRRETLNLRSAPEKCGTQVEASTDLCLGSGRPILDTWQQRQHQSIVASHACGSCRPLPRLA